MFPPQRPVTYRFFRTESGDTLLSIRIPGRAIPGRHVASAIREGPIPESGERLHRVFGHTKAWETGELECDALHLPEPEATWAIPHACTAFGHLPTSVQLPSGLQYTRKPCLCVNSLYLRP